MKPNTRGLPKPAQGGAIPKDIAVVSYNLNPTSSLTADAVVVRDQLNRSGYTAELVDQWAFNEPNAATFKPADQWEKYDGIVICSFYESWNLRELIQAARPVLCHSLALLALGGSHGKQNSVQHILLITEVRRFVHCCDLIARVPPGGALQNALQVLRSFIGHLFADTGDSVALRDPWGW